MRSNEDVTTVTSMSVSEAQLTESTLSDLIVLMVGLGPGEDGNVAWSAVRIVRTCRGVELETNLNKKFYNLREGPY